MKTHHQEKKIIESLTPEQKQHFPFVKIKEDPAFQTKRPAHPLALADFVAFVIKRALMGDPKIWPFFEPWKECFSAWRCPGRS